MDKVNMDILSLLLEVFVKWTKGSQFHDNHHWLSSTDT